jgi:hypothetical protein
MAAVAAVSSSGLQPDRRTHWESPNSCGYTRGLASFHRWMLAGIRLGWGTGGHTWCQGRARSGMCDDSVARRGQQRLGRPEIGPPEGRAQAAQIA